MSPSRPGLRERARDAWRRLRGGELSPARAALSTGLGAFIGCTPLYGLHLPLCLLVCVPLGLDTVIAYLAANISNPLIAPFLVTLEIEVGSLLLYGHHAAFSVAQARATGIAGFAAQAASGSVIVGAAIGAVGAAGAWLAASWRVARRDRALAAAIDRTMARYRGAPRGDRFYVSSKLRSDPVLRMIAALDGPFGTTLDLGAGRGQLGLCLLELGRVRELWGIDWDTRKVEVAQRAAGDSARFERGDLAKAAIAPVDTILLADVLHYFQPAVQDEILGRAAAALRPGGRVIVRETDAEQRGRGRLVRLVERVLVRVGYNRGGRLAFRSARELTQTLENLGLTCDAPQSDAPGSANVLIVASRPT